MINLDENKILFLVQYGSHNYNLNVKDSDFDWRGFSNQVAYKEVLNYGFESNDICINNTGYLYKALSEMIPKYLELLFSENIIISNKISIKTKSLINELFNLKDEIVIMDKPCMFRSFLSDFKLHQEWIKENKNPHRNVNYLIHSFRILDILYRFAYADFKDYKSSFKYSDSELNREIIIKTKLKEIPINALNEMIETKMNGMESLKGYYDERPNLKTINTLKEIIQNISLEVIK